MLYLLYPWQHLLATDHLGQSLRLLLLQVLFFGPSTDPMKISIAVYFHFSFNGALQTLHVHSGTLITLMHSTVAHVQ